MECTFRTIDVAYSNLVMSAWDLIPSVEIASFAAKRTRNMALSNALTAIQKEAIAQMRTKDDKKCS